MWQYDPQLQVDTWVKDGPAKYTDYLDNEPYGDYEASSAYNRQAQQLDVRLAEARRCVGGWF